MEIFTGDTQGFVKAIKIQKKGEQLKQHDLRLLSTKLPEHEVSRVPGFDIFLQVYGDDNVQNEVQYIKWAEMPSRFSRESEKLLLVARKNGVIDLLSSTDGSVLCTYPVFMPSPSKLDSRKMQEHFIGLQVRDGIAQAATSNGLVAFIDIKQDFPLAPDCANPLKPYTLFNLNMDGLCVFEPHPQTIGKFATGGFEKELALWDAEKELSEQSPDDSLRPVVELAPIWKAKNVKNDFLDLRVPVWITGIHWISSSELLISTGRAQLRYYSIEKSRRPLKEHALAVFEDHPISKMAFTDLYPNSVLVSDTTGTLVRFNWDKGVQEARYKGATGAIRDIAFLDDVAIPQLKHSRVPVVVAAGIDRSLRIWHLKGKHTLLGQVYLVQHTTAICLARVENTKGKDDDDDDKLWDSLEKIKDGDDAEKSVKRPKLCR